MAKDFDNRVENIKLMHETMLSMSNENAYMKWIYTMPDCPTEEDIEEFASDLDEYCDLCETFMEIVKRYKKSGLFEPSRAVFDFQMRLGLGLEVFGIVHDARPTYKR